MRIGIIGLGRMGTALAWQARERGHEVVGYSRDVSDDQELMQHGVVVVDSIEAMVNQLTTPRIIFLYVPHGEPTDEVSGRLRPKLAAGDIVLDGGNSHWQDSASRYDFFAEKGVRFLDVGTSGGISGAKYGACFMVGGDRDAFEVVRPLLLDLAIDEEAVIFAGRAGSGHFVKLIHNAIEFGMVQSIAEGVEMLQRSEFHLDLSAVLKNWNHGSVIRGWLLELAARALEEQTDFSSLSTYVEDTGELKWVLEWASREDIPTPVVTQSQQMLMLYRDPESAAAKTVALIRNQFGGHPIHKRQDSSGQVHGI